MKCYAYSLYKRFNEKAWKLEENDFQPQWVGKWFDKPFPRKQSRIFMTAMSDPADWEPMWMIKIILKIIDNNTYRDEKGLPLHQFYFLTKRPKKAYFDYNFPDNCYCGITVTNERTLNERWNTLNIELNNPYLYMEPFKFDKYPFITNLDKLKWIIIGGESGNKDYTLNWYGVHGVYRQCVDHDIPFFYKDTNKLINGTPNLFPKKSVPFNKGY
jgi:protein gp37